MQKPRCQIAVALGAAVCAGTMLGVLGARPAAAAEAQRDKQPGRYNVLFIAVDDLRPEAGWGLLPAGRLQPVAHLAADGPAS